VGPDFHRPEAPTVRAYALDPLHETVAADGESQRFNESQALPLNWWRMLASPALDALVDQAIIGNPGLEVARATLRRSHDSLRAGYGVFFPDLDFHAGASRQHYDPAPGVLPSSTFNLFTVSGTVSYGLDLWGGSRRQVEALGAAVDAQRYALAGAYVMLTSNVVNTAIAQAAYRAEIDVTKETIALLAEQIRAAAAQATAGTAPYSTVLTLQSQLALTQALLPSLEARIDQAGSLLAALSGTTAAEFKQPVLALGDLHLPLDLPLSLPSALVRQRPDVLIAEAELHAANAAIGVATAAMLPNLTLSADYGLSSTGAGSIGPLWSVGAALTQPILHGGALYYQRKAAIDARDIAVAAYRQTVLGAFQQVTDSMRSLGHDADLLNAETAAVNAAGKAVHLLLANYRAGLVTYLPVLVADIQYQDAKSGHVQAVAQRLQDTVALFVALGGGWWNDPSALHE
jgi:NodT family efflux transporter outer membrane factor (OMF) lipoprotein